MTNEVRVPSRLIDLLKQAMDEGWYEDHSGWEEVKQLLTTVAASPQVWRMQGKMDETNEVIKRIASELAPELDRLIELSCYQSEADDENVRWFLWDNKVGILRCLQAISDTVQQESPDRFAPSEATAPSLQPPDDIKALVDVLQGIIKSPWADRHPSEVDTALRRAANALERQVLAVEAARALVARMDEIYEHPAFKSVWTVSQMHVGPYAGPKWESEFNRLKAALAASPTPPSEGGAK